MSAPFVDFAEIKQDVSYAQVLTMLGIVVKPDGPNALRGACPFCNDRRSFRVTTDAGRDGLGLGGCFKCGQRGLDSIGLVARLRGIKNNEAVVVIQEHFGLGKGTVSMARKSTVPPPGNSTDPIQVPQPAIRLVFDPQAYAARLETEHPSLAALALAPETLKRFKAGYAKSGPNAGRLAIGVADRTGTIVGFCGRALTPEQQPELIFPKGFPDPAEYIYNAHNIQPGELYVVQDPVKVLTAFEAGQENVVAFLTDGVSAIQHQMLAALMDEKHCERSYSF